jgi:hypothetical protein
MADQVTDVLFAAGEIVIETDDGVSFLDQPIREVRPEKSSSPGDKYSFGHVEPS